LRFTVSVYVLVVDPSGAVTLRHRTIMIRTVD